MNSETCRTQVTTASSFHCKREFHRPDTSATRTSPWLTLMGIRLTTHPGSANATAGCPSTTQDNLLLLPIMISAIASRSAAGGSFPSLECGLLDPDGWPTAGAPIPY